VTPTIHVSPRAAQWMNYLAQPAEPAQRVGRATVHVMKAGEELGGPSAIGRPGDLLLGNDEVVFVIDQLGSSAGFAESGGNVIDAADARVRKDELGQVFTYFGVFPRQAVYGVLSSGAATDGSAWIEAQGRDLYEEKLVVTTRYTLAQSDRALLIETTLQNNGKAPIALVSVGDAIQWGGAEKVAPGKAPGFLGHSSGAYVGGVGRFTSYALTSTEGTIDADSGRSWTDTALRKGVSLGVGEKTSYARVLIVGERPDTTSIVGELAMAAAQPVGEIEIALHGGSLPTGEAVELRVEGSNAALSVAATAADGSPLVARVPVGRYWARLRATAAPLVGPVDVAASARVHVDIPVEAPAALEAGCANGDKESFPCKLTFEGVGGSKTPDFGNAYAAGAARNQVTTAGPAVGVRLAAGKYRILASRGLEYALDDVEIDLRPGASRSVWLHPKRVVDTRGYLACDFHQHTILGTDAPVATRDRVIANAAEGVEVAVASEHNVVASLQPLVDALGLKNDLVSLAGDEITSDASLHPWGHANAWPLLPDAGKARGGAPVVRDRTPSEVFDELRRGPGGGDVVVQINHPRSGETGYFDRLGFDAARGVGTNPAYDARFDALEVWNGHNLGPRGRIIEDFRALLRSGHPVTATADSDTHGIVGQEAGYPRTYVRVADDEHLEAWDAARTADLARGMKILRDVVLTNGPMLRVSANGAPIGAVARGRTIAVNVHVESAPWLDVDTVRIVRSDGAGRDDDAHQGAGEERRAVKLVASPKRAQVLAVDVSFTLRFDRDDAFFVVASGSRSMSPVLPQGEAVDAAASGDDAERLPWAMTGAIWVDADGDGASLGR